MRIPYLAIIAMIVAVFFALTPAHAVKSTAKWGNISTAELSAKLESGEDVCLINVLPQIIHDSKHIKGSINIPIGRLPTSLKLPDDKSKLLVFYCMGTL